MWLVFALPVLMGAAAWATATVAIRFLISGRFLGAPGHLARHAHRIGPELVDRIVDQIVAVPELFDIIGEEHVTRHLVESTEPHVGALLERIMLDQDAILWEGMNEATRRAIVLRITEHLPDVAAAFVRDLRSRIDELLDLDALAHTALVEDPERLGRIVKAAAGTDLGYFRTMAVRLAVLGAAVPVTIALAGGNAWIGAGATAIALAAAARIALWLVFRPLRPVEFLGTSLQGSIMRRQHEVAQIATREVLSEIASVPRMAATLFEGPNAREARALGNSYTEPLVRHAVEPAYATVVEHLGRRGAERFVSVLAQRVIDVCLDQFNDPSFAFERQIAAEQVLVCRVQAMTPEHFEHLLRPLIKDIEALILPAGAISGTVAAVVFGLLSGAVG